MRLMPQQMEDNQLIEEVRLNGSSDCFKEIVNRHSGIYLQMVHSYAPRETAVDNFFDLLNSKESHIYDAIQSYDEKRNIKFSTYLGNCTRWLCLNSSNKKRFQQMDENFDCIFESTESKEKNENQILNEIFSSIESLEDKRVFKIFKMRYLNEKKKLTPWRKIAKELDLSIQGCINIHNSAFKKLKKTYQKKYD
ncbi:MAG: sigma-70 family RNA polymerase sigma factor [Bacteroidetes bacterium]|nr:sigma-70 family RNA polymerase sigma factor [Bacteroidota bacterium]